MSAEQEAAHPVQKSHHVASLVHPARASAVWRISDVTFPGSIPKNQQDRLRPALLLSPSKELQPELISDHPLNRLE